MKIKGVFMMMVLSSMSVLTMAQEPLKSGVDLTDLNQTVKPGEDFYEYACGGWMKKNPLPAAYSRFGSFDRLAEDNNKRINGILKELLENTYPEGTVEQQLSDLYKLAMDSVRREKDGIAPAMPIIQKMEAAKTKEQLFAIQLELMPYGNMEFFHAYFGADDKNASQNILSINQGGLTLGQKDYYLENDEATVKIREAYKEHIVRMFQLFGFKKSVAEKKMKNIMKVETALAKVSKSRTELRDPIANYNKMTFVEFDAKYPHFQLEKQANAMGVKSEYIQEMVVGQPAFMAAADEIFAKMTPEEYRDVMEWGQIGSAAGFLNDAVREANFRRSSAVATCYHTGTRLYGRRVRAYLCQEVFPCFVEGAYEETGGEPAYCSG